MTLLTPELFPKITPKLSSKLPPELTSEEKQIITSHSFAQLLSSKSNNTGFAELSYCPLLLIESHQLLGHLANNNSLFNAVEDKATVQVNFSGPHGYISPRWHNEQRVPTWNYATVSLLCSIKFIQSPVEKLKAMKVISHHYDPLWEFNKFNQEKNKRMVQQMLSAITVFTLDIIDVNSKFKLSQNRSIACRKAFQQQLTLSGNSQLAAIQLN